MAFVIDDFLIATAISGAVSGTANVISGNAASNQARENINTYIKEISKNYISDEQLDDLLTANKRVFNNRLVSTLNVAALRSNNIANSGVIGGAISGGIAAAQASSEVQLKEGVRQQNAGVTSAIAQARLGTPPKDPIGNFFTGAIPGIQTGIEVSKFINNLSPASSPIEKVQPGVVPDPIENPNNFGQLDKINSYGFGSQPTRTTFSNPFMGTVSNPFLVENNPYYNLGGQ